MQFTPALSKYLLTTLHPALGGAVGMRGATRVQARLMPHNGLLPSKQVGGWVGRWGGGGMGWCWCVGVVCGGAWPA